MSRGFTLVEAIITLAIIAAIAAFSLSAYQQFRLTSDLALATQTVVKSLRLAEGWSLAVKEDDGWSLKLQNGQATVFKGNSYISRDTFFDRNFSLPSGIELSGLDEISFIKLSGIPAITGQINLTHSSGEKNIQLNEKGTINY